MLFNDYFLFNLLKIGNILASNPITFDSKLFRIYVAESF